MEDHEDVVREYDPVLMRRILSYVKPYRLRFILAIFALLVTTVFDMFIPILIQRTVDRDILPYYYAVQEESLDPSLRVKALAVEGSFHAGGMLFLPGKALTDFSEREKEVLRAANPDFRLPFLAFRVTEENRETIERYNRSEAGTLFFMGDGFAAIREAEKGRITPKDLKIIRGENYRHIRNTAVVYLVILVLSFVFTFIQIYAMALLGQEVMKDLRSELYDHTLRRSLSFLDKNPVGRIVTRITNDVETINELFGEVITSFFKDISLMIGVFVTLFLLSPRLAGYSIVTLPFLGIAAVIFRKKARDAYRRVRIAVSRLNAFLSEHISGMSTVQAFVHEKLSIAQFRLRATELLASNLGEMYVFATFRPIVDIIATVALAIVLYAGAGAFLQGRVSLGVLIAFINLVGKFFDPVRDLAEKYTTLQ
ncbi:MAG TPA: ABC transporter ATP-binding protein, partial [Spirochaetia bacterium]|nr:ABC transporter ATP-binding protein [Spirochaetia bacterium]